MKVIDLLNKIANDEELPQLIKWNGYIYDKLGCEYYMLNDRDLTLFGDILDTNGKYLNDEVEIIEEDKKIKKLVFNKDQDGDILVNGVSLIEKVNEIIDKVNKEK